MTGRTGAGKNAGVKIFLSYGHDANAALVARVQKDLVHAGHKIWIDSEKIRHADDWRRRITEGLRECDWVLAFLSRHSVRDPGVCLDEIGMALGLKGGAIAPILAEPEAQVQIPVSIGHIQWLDMSDWAAHHQEGGAVWEAWYRPLLDRLLARLAAPETQRFAGEISRLETLLQPAAQDADMPRLLEGFVGRVWLRDRVDAWRKAPESGRGTAIYGQPGLGKSAFAAWMAHYGRANVVALNLCRYNLALRHESAQVVRTLAFQIATRLPDYRRLLLDWLERRAASGHPLAALPAADLFDALLVQLLHRGIDGGRRNDRFLIIVDALDETLRDDGRSVLAELLDDRAPNLPPWIALLVTSRPEPEIKRQFSGFRPLDLDRAAAENQDDLRAYVRDWLAAHGQDQARAEPVVAAADGNFLYVREVLKDAAAGLGDLATPAGLPRGLVGVFLRRFRHVFPDVARYRAELAPALAVLCAAEQPVPLVLLARMQGWDEDARETFLEALGGHLERRGEAVAPFHKSLRDWLTTRAEASGAYFIDPAPGTLRLAGALRENLRRWLDDPAQGQPDCFTLTELPLQLPRLPEPASRDWMAACGDRNRLAAGIVAIVAGFCATFAWPQALSWLRALRHLAAALGSEGDGWAQWAAWNHGDLLLPLGDLAGARTAYEDYFAICKRRAASDPDDTDSQRNLSVSHNKLGEVIQAQGDLAGARDTFRAGMDIRARLAARDPDNAEWQRDLSVSHNRLGDVMQAQGDLAGARDAFRAGMAIAAHLAARDPDNAQWQRDLSISHEKLGDVMQAQGDLAGARDAFRAGMDIRARLAARDPDNAQWQRDLSISHNKLGDVMRAQGDLAGARDAFRADMDIAARLAARDPDNAQWQRDLSISHEKLGDVMQAQGDLAGARDAFRAGMDIRARLAARDPDNAQWQRGLFVSAWWLADVHAALGEIGPARDFAGQALAQAQALMRRYPDFAEHAEDLRSAEALHRLICGV